MRGGTLRSRALHRFAVAAGIVYGVFLLMLAFWTSFSLTGTDLFASAVFLLLGLSSVLPLCVLAIYRPRTSSVALLICFSVALYSLLSSESWHREHVGIGGYVRLFLTWIGPEMFLIVSFWVLRGDVRAQRR